MQSLPKLDVVLVVASALVALLLLSVASYALVRWLRTPKDKEMRRRLMVNQLGRLGDATITDLQGDVLYYSYSVAGVSYAASQDVATLRDHLPADAERLIGSVASLKYSPQNPANSIVVCEVWSGLRIGSTRES